MSPCQHTICKLLPRKFLHIELNHTDFTLKLIPLGNICSVHNIDEHLCTVTIKLGFHRVLLTTERQYADFLFWKCFYNLFILTIQ